MLLACSKQISKMATFGKCAADRPKQGLDGLLQRWPLVLGSFINHAPCLKRIGCETIKRMLVLSRQNKEGAIFRLRILLDLGNVNDNASPDNFSGVIIAFVVPSRQQPTHPVCCRAHAILGDQQSSMLTHAIDVGGKLFPVRWKDSLHISSQRQSPRGLRGVEAEQGGDGGIRDGTAVFEIRLPNADLRGGQCIGQKFQPVSTCTIRHAQTPNPMLK